MEAIEFIVEKQHGKIIEIPEQYLDAISGTFRVIILLDSTPESEPVRKREFKAVKLKTKDFKFNREELYSVTL